MHKLTPLTKTCSTPHHTREIKALMQQRASVWGLTVAFSRTQGHSGGLALTNKVYGNEPDFNIVDELVSPLSFCNGRVGFCLTATQQHACVFICPLAQMLSHNAQNAPLQKTLRKTVSASCFHFRVNWTEKENNVRLSHTVRHPTWNHFVFTFCLYSWGGFIGVVLGPTKFSIC